MTCSGVTIAKLRAFCPASQIDTIRDADPASGQSLGFGSLADKLRGALRSKEE
jgi:hypothetical protein